MQSPVISLRNIVKRFGPVVANHEVSFDVYPGRVHALLGENGAGKSTLMSILAGRYRADGGTVVIHGAVTELSSPADALKQGIGMVYQRFMLIESMTVAENIALSTGKKPTSPLHKAIVETAELYGFGVKPEQYIHELSMGERQRVEIIKLLMLNARVLIFDEPTAVLTPVEVEAFFELIQRLRQDNKAIIFITHKLEEVLTLADDISILRKGRLILSTRVDKKQLSKAQLARLMVGRDVILRVDKEPLERKQPVLELKGLSGGAVKGLTSYQNVSFTVHRGEIFSIIGVAGNGQSSLVSAITGLSAAASGSILFMGREYTPAQWHRFSKNAIAYVPEDRHHTGSVGSMSIAENFGLTRIAQYGRWLGKLMLNREQMYHDGVVAIEDFAIKAESPDDRAASLSGGNLQKVILARELARNPQLFIAEQPTQGLDISATEEVWKALLECRKRAGVLLVSGDLKEVLSLSDRIGVIFGGRILEIIDAHDGEAVSRVGLLMAGVQ